MPLIAYIRAHGSTDFPHHFVFFSELERRGVLDRFDFVLDTMMDREYCLQLAERFPQLKLSDQTTRTRSAMRWVAERLGKGYRHLAFFDRFDAVCEAPGGRINPIYTGGLSPFRLYPRVRRRAILFHSIEPGAMKQPAVRQAVAECELVITRTAQSAKNALEAGAKHVVESADVVLLSHPQTFGRVPGVAISLRLPNEKVTENYTKTIWEIIEGFEKTGIRSDFVLVEEPVGMDMKRKGYGTPLRPTTGLYYNDTMYNPFLDRRDAIISSRLHTTLIAILHGNRKIMQYHIEGGTNKTEEILGDMGLSSLKVHRSEDLSWSNIHNFLDSGPEIPESTAMEALDLAKKKADKGMDAFLEWLDTI